MGAWACVTHSTCYSGKQCQTVHRDWSSRYMEQVQQCLVISAWAACPSLVDVLLLSVPWYLSYWITYALQGIQWSSAEGTRPLASYRWSISASSYARPWKSASLVANSAWSEAAQGSQPKWSRWEPGWAEVVVEAHPGEEPAGRRREPGQRGAGPSQPSRVLEAGGDAEVRPKPGSRKEPRSRWSWAAGVRAGPGSGAAGLRTEQRASQGWAEVGVEAQPGRR